MLAGIAAAPAQTLLEAEHGTLTGVAVATAAAGYSGSGYVTGFDAPGDKVAWTFTAAAGVHRLTIRYRTPFGTKGFGGALNGDGLSGMFPASAGFAVHDAGLVELAAGANTLEIGGGWNWYEIDAVALAPATPVAPLPVPAVPCDPLATPAARHLLETVTAGYGTTTLSGQHELADASHVLAVSGELPAVIEGDLIDYSPSRVERQGMPAGYTESILAARAAGHLAAFSWHWNAPTDLLDTPEQPWWRGFYTEATTFDVAAALADPGGPNHALLLRDIDAIAAQLRKAADANVPLLWRPLHEAEGGWFWWGARGPAPFKQLWRLLHDRLTSHHGLHNLVWVLTNEHPDWYPGDDVVDVVGADGYPDNRSDALSSRWEALLARFDGVKPLALTEFGGVPDVERMHRLGVTWAWFCSWAGSAGPASEPDAKVARVYQSAAVVTRGELPPPPTPFQLWQKDAFGAAAGDPLVAGESADPDRDGLANLLEYALGTGPLTPGPAPCTATLVTAGDGAPFLCLTAHRNPLATDLTFNVEVAPDPGGGWNTAETLVLTDTPALLVARDTGGGPRRFIRLRVERGG